MAELISNKKGFLVLKTTRKEIISIGPNNLGICDRCNNPDSLNGYYVGVLNWWMCLECYNTWYNKAVKYQEDVLYELSHFLPICAALEVVFTDDYSQNIPDDKMKEYVKYMYSHKRTK